MNTLEQLPPLSMPLKDLYAKLLSTVNITIIRLLSMQPRFLVWYKPDSTYEYHTGNLTRPKD